MNIIIINVIRNWIYRLYEEYILSIKDFIKEHYNNVNIDIIYNDVETFNINNFHFENYDKIFYTGDLEILKQIIYKINNLDMLYFINIEQMSHHSYYKMIRTINNNINIIDYSEENIPFFENIHKNIFLFPPYFKTKDNINKTIDVISIVNNEYRSNILKNINFDLNLNILFLDNCYNDIRDKYFSESKIYINIHCSDNHNTMELIRIVNLIMNKVIIISQKSIYSNLLFLNKYILICNDLNDMGRYINDILTNYDYCYNKLYGDFDPKEYYKYIKKNADKIITS